MGIFRELYGSCFVLVPNQVDESRGLLQIAESVTPKFILKRVYTTLGNSFSTPPSFGPLNDFLRMT